MDAPLAVQTMKKSSTSANLSGSRLRQSICSMTQVSQRILVCHIVITLLLAGVPKINKETASRNVNSMLPPVSRTISETHFNDANGRRPLHPARAYPS